VKTLKWSFGSFTKNFFFKSDKGEVENNSVSLTPVGFFSEYLRLCCTGKQSNLLLKIYCKYITVAESAVLEFLHNPGGLGTE
jgi:hypothetical protein